MGRGARRDVAEHGNESAEPLRDLVLLSARQRREHIREPESILLQRFQFLELIVVPQAAEVELYDLAFWPVPRADQTAGIVVPCACLAPIGHADKYADLRL